MNITTLQYFVSAAELSSFTKAAKRHFIAQTAISQQIAKLENYLGAELFTREKNRVLLTDVGHVFYEDIKNILREYEYAVNKAGKYHLEAKKVITIGYKERAELQLLTEVIREFQKQFPYVEFVIKESIIYQVLDEIKHELCDLFINISCTLTENDMIFLDHYTVYNGSMVLGVSMEHPKAEREFVEAKELAEEKFIVLNTDNDYRGVQEMHNHCREDGYELQICEYAPNIGSQLMMVELNRGVAFIQDLMINSTAGRIKYIPILNSAHKYNVDIIWNKNSTNGILLKFIGFIKKSFHGDKA